MTRLEKKLAALQSAGRKGFFVYITAGTPTIDESFHAMVEAEKAGADVIEIGIPFSDPLADGPVIQNSSVTALRNGITLEKILELSRKIRAQSDIPLIGMGYINNFMSYGYSGGSAAYDGFEKFIVDAKNSGIDGVIIPDVPHEESQQMRDICRRHEVHLTEFITPETTLERMKSTCATASGFVYCVSNTGVTGVKKIDYSRINAKIRDARQFTSVPMAVGFGIGSGETAVQAAQNSDAVIVGSAVVKLLHEGKFTEAMNLIAEIRAALDKISAS